MSDPYVYPNTHVLINKEDIRDAADLEQFERLMTAQRLREGLPKVPLTADGYRTLHEHLFQDVYEWAGKTRTVDIAKNNAMFCFAAYVDGELDKRFAAIRDENGLQGLSVAQFAERAGEHLSELNAVHPFREGNGRTQRAFLVVLAEQAGHKIDLQRIDPIAWNEASKQSFSTADSAPMREVILGSIVLHQPPLKTQPPNGPR
jgi:cell filamentation protein